MLPCMPKRVVRNGPDESFDRAAAARAGGLVAGLDEAGRGPWAGPVVAAAVVFLPGARLPAGLDDSKALAPARRAELSEQIRAIASIGIGIAGVDRIDRDNILAASLWAMAEAFRALALVPAVALVDGNRAPELPCPITTIVGGDGRSPSIAAASIIAKVHRDALMREIGRVYPGYGFERHKGYGTAAHRSALARLGVTPEHRRSFRPVQIALGRQPDE